MPNENVARPLTATEVRQRNEANSDWQVFEGAFRPPRPIGNHENRLIVATPNRPDQQPAGEILPETLYVTYEGDNGWAGHPQPAFLAVDSLEHPNLGVDRRVGVYKLVDVKQLKVRRELV